MPQLDVYSDSDAEVFIMNAALSRVARSVGSYSGRLDPGLYKIRVNRAGTVREQLIELGDAPQQHRLHIERFAAIAPIAPMLGDAGAIEALAREALAVHDGEPAILVLAHGSVATTDAERLLAGASLFPWRATRRAVRLDRGRRSAEVGDDVWAAVAVRAHPQDGPFVLELGNGARVSRQAVLVAHGWQTRIFLRAGEPGAGYAVSLQMARPAAPVVYADHEETVEVARSALERGRAIFTSDRLVHALFHQKYQNPIAGMTGLHLFLDAKERRESGDASYGVAAFDGDTQAVADEVLVNLTKLLYPERAAAARGNARPAAALDDALRFPDPGWPESADLTALRIRAGRCREQIVIPSPPMFRASWDVLKAHAGRGGQTWISRQLWSSTGAAGAIGPYLAWARGRHSFGRTVQRIGDQFAAAPQPVAAAASPASYIGAAVRKIIEAGTAAEVRSVRPAAASPASGVGAAFTAIAEAGAATQAGLRKPRASPADAVDEVIAAGFGLPLSIFQKTR